MKEEKPSNIWAKIGDIPRPALYWLLIIVMAISMLVPLNLPVAIGAPSQDFHKTIESLPRGSRAIIAPEANSGNLYEIGAAEELVIQRLLERGCKVVIVNTEAAAYPVLTNLVQRLGLRQKYVYGQDFVVLGYLAGAETAIAQMADNFRAAVKADYQGTSIDALPILNDVKGAKDFALAIVVSGLSYSFTGWPRFWAVAYGTPVLIAPTSMVIPDIVRYYSAGVVKGYLNGLKGTAEYEKLLGRPGSAIRGMDMINATHLYLLVWIVLGNIALVAERLRGKK